MKRLLTTTALGALVALAAPAWGNQDCPNDQDFIPLGNFPGVEDIDHNGNGVLDTDPNVVCMQRAGGDGFIQNADGTSMYLFGFSPMDDVAPADVFTTALLKAQSPAPTIVVKEGQSLYLTLFTTGMAMRPDLFDPHTIHWHGFREAAPVYDGVPNDSIAVNPQASFTYYYAPHHPGTYMYHCHVEATEHMQMGMIGNLWVTPLQDELPDGTLLGSFIHHTGYHYAYDDGDGSTYYDRDYPLQVLEFDSIFHGEDLRIQPLSFADLREQIFTFNGRAYPDTVATTPPQVPWGMVAAPVVPGTFDLPDPPVDTTGTPLPNYVSQPVGSLITAAPGQHILLRLGDVSVVDYTTITSLGIPMRVVGKDTRLLRGPSGVDLSYQTNSVTMGGGEIYDVILDIPTTAQVGDKFFVYARNLNHLNSNQMDRSGTMTEIHIQ